MSVTPESPGAMMLRRILAGEAPLNLRSAAARGALPLPRTDLVRIWVALLDDAEERVRRDAETSLAELDDDDVRTVLADESCAADVLAHFAARSARDEKTAAVIAFHRNVPDAALELFAAQGNSAVIALVLTNEERLATQPALLERLTLNPALRADQRGRILELLARSARLAGDAADDAAGKVPADDAAEAARLLDVDVGELFAASEIMGAEEFEQAEDPVIRSAYQRIITLSPAQKAILAMKGGREERMILVRDTNKVVSLAAIKNPRISDNEIEAISKMRNVSDEVLRVLGTNREWVRSYPVVLNLVRNPRTPPGISTNFIARLQNRDLKNLLRDHNVPEVVRKMAKRVFDTRTQSQNRLGARKRG